MKSIVSFEVQKRTFLQRPPEVCFVPKVDTGKRGALPKPNRIGHPIGQSGSRRQKAETTAAVELVRLVT